MTANSRAIGRSGGGREHRAGFLELCPAETWPLAIHLIRVRPELGTRLHRPRVDQCTQIIYPGMPAEAPIVPMPLTLNHKGPLYRDFIARIISLKQARGYLEVGVRDGATLALVDCPSIGVDPSFQISVNPAGRKSQLHLYQMTSDKFFRDYDPRMILGCPLDVVFLDGLHQFEFLLRDFINSEALCSKGALIMLDDCLPVNSEMTERYHDAEGRVDKELAWWWTGDVWKMLPILKKYRPDLRIFPVNTQPTGCICITNLDQTSKVLSDNFYKIVDDYKNVVMDDDMLAKFYSENDVLSAEDILHGFDASMYVGP